MATNQRDVSLNVAVKTSGSEDLQGLAGDVRAVGGAAAGSTEGVDRLAQELGLLTAATAAARAAQQAARADLNTHAAAYSRLRAGTDAAGKATSEYRAAEIAARVAVNEARIALRDKTAAAAAAVAAQTSLRESISATTAATVVGNSAVSKSIGDIKGQLSALQSVAIAATGGTLVGSLAKDITNTAEAYQSLSARLKIATGDSGDFAGTLQGVFEVANRTGVAVAEVGALVTKLIASGKELGLTNQQALGLAETLTQSLRIGGASAQEAASSVTQFAQAMASGKLAGDELKSILETSPRLSKALADGLGVSIGKLKELGAAGALTSAQVVAALQGQSAALQAEFDRMPITVSRAMANLSNAWTQYIGKANEGSGAASIAAAAIETLARNLDTVAALLYSAGKAAAAFYAVRLGQAFLETATAATTAAAATATATAATATHTAATRANAVAQGEAAAAAGRFASILASVKVFALIAVISNLKEIGTWLGEGIAKWQGYGKVLDAAERSAQANAEATRRLTLEKTALAQATQQAADRALGLNDAARKLVAEFDGVILKGESSADALDKLAKALRLDDLTGIQAAGAALDALAQRGKISAYQITRALGEALKGADLLVFETTARAAFDSSEQGARRLKAALDAIADESLKRAGTSADELRSGFSHASTSAINDVDALSKTLRDLRVTGDDAGRVLGVSLDKALTAATTERAVRAVIDRMHELAAAGLLTGDRLADGLDKAGKKLDELVPGVNSLAEAFRVLGLTTRDDAQRTADRLGEAYRTIANSGAASVAQQIDAYARWRSAALEATGGVESGHLAEQRVILQTRAAVAGLGDEYERAMGRAERSVRRVGASVHDETSRMVAGFGAVTAAAQVAENAALRFGSALQSTQYDKDKFALNGDGSRFTASGQLKPPDDSGDWTFVGDVRTNNLSAPSGAVAVPGQGYWKKKPSAKSDLPSTPTPTSNNGPNGRSLFASQAARQDAINTSHTVTINLAGKSTTVATSTAGDASALAQMLRELENSMRAMGA